MSSRFPNACVGSCYNHSLPVNSSLTWTPASRHMVPIRHQNTDQYPHNFHFWQQDQPLWIYLNLMQMQNYIYSDAYILKEVRRSLHPAKCNFHPSMSRFILYIQWQKESLVIWCNNNLRLNINKIKQPVLHYNAFNVDVVAKMLHRLMLNSAKKIFGTMVLNNREKSGFEEYYDIRYLSTIFLKTTVLFH